MAQCSFCAFQMMVFLDPSGLTQQGPLAFSPTMVNHIPYHNCMTCSCAVSFSSPAAASPAPAPEGTSASPAPATPAAIPTALSATPTAPPEEEDPALSPHLLLPDSLSQLEEFGRQKKWHKRQNKHQRPRQFNDLWVRIEDR